MPAYTQVNRPMRVTTAKGDDGLMLLRVSGEEGISTPFRFTLWILAPEDQPIVAADVLRTPITATIQLPDGGERELTGLVSRFTQLGCTEKLVTYRAEIVPWLWFLSQMSDCRIFQHLTVPEILQKVFKDNGFSDFDLKLSKSYPKREFCVQYRETHLNFVSRLMEEEGIFYYFEHASQKHKMVVSDDSKFAPTVPGSSTARMAPTDGTTVLDEDVVLTSEWEHAVHSGKVTLRDYNYLKPTLALEISQAGAHKSELYDYPGEYAERADGTRLARIRLEEKEAGQESMVGESRCRHFVTGHRFTLEEHYSPAANQTYLLIDISHEAEMAGYRTGVGEGFTYTNTFRAIPDTVPYRPPMRAEKPVMQGSQTAIVVGPAGEEIYVDKYGRVKVQFHWDRLGKKDENSSCWVRVSTLWAGKQWGVIQIPRIGQEVIVDFLEGDPDQPVITGSVYNADQMPPYPLPGSGTMSGVKSNSSKGGGGSNELSFEDKKGEELVFIHAQKDKVVAVENNRTESVGKDESIKIGNDQRVDIGGNRTETVAKNETITISKNRSENVKENESITIGKDRSRSVAGAETIDISKDRSTSVGKSDSLSVAENRQVEIGKSDTLDVGKSLLVTAADEIVLKSGSGSITIKKSGEITIKGKDITINGSGKINVKASSDVVLKGSKIQSN